MLPVSRDATLRERSVSRKWQAVPADRAAGPPMGNPAAGPVVTYLLSVVLVLVAAFPVRQDRHVRRRHQPAVPGHPFPGGCPSLLRWRGGCPRAGPLRASAAATSPSTSRPPRASSSRCRSGTGIQRDPNRPAMEPSDDRDRSRRPAKSYEVQGSRGVPTGGAPGPWHRRRLVRRSAGRPSVRPIKAQDGVKVRLETVADGLTAPVTGVPAAERPSPCR